MAYTTVNVTHGVTSKLSRLFSDNFLAFVSLDYKRARHLLVGIMNAQTTGSILTNDALAFRGGSCSFT